MSWSERSAFLIILQRRIPDFPEEGAPTPRGGHQHTILPKFPKNCMKLKEFGPPGGGGARVPCAPLRSATVLDLVLDVKSGEPDDWATLVFMYSGVLSSFEDPGS